ncbi:hypothetical protein T492DRAFT_857804 [Pavlovales sp. CCMP2436]|nr:hypothetical protein T492DRAFT_857804 [Pavlovales sp. CCMP2436]
MGIDEGQFGMKETSAAAAVAGGPGPDTPSKWAAWTTGGRVGAARGAGPSGWLPGTIPPRASPAQCRVRSLVVPVSWSSGGQSIDVKRAAAHFTTQFACVSQGGQHQIFGRWLHAASALRRATGTITLLLTLLCNDPLRCALSADR